MDIIAITKYYLVACRTRPKHHKRDNYGRYNQKKLFQRNRVNHCRLVNREFVENLYHLMERKEYSLGNPFSTVLLESYILGVAYNSPTSK